MSNLIELVVAWVLVIIARFGYTGIFVTMALESAAVTIPSEIVLPFSGFLASQGQLNFWLVVLVATVANLAGAIFIFWVGYFGGRYLLERYGKYVLLHHQEIVKMDNWLVKYQSWAIFMTRLMPGLRTFNSLIIGSARGISFVKFIFFTTLGSFIWNFVLVYAGFVAGDHWNFLAPYFHKADILIVLLVAIAVVWFVYRHLHKNKSNPDTHV